MEIKAIIPTIPAIPAIPAATPAPEAKPPQAVERNLQGTSGAAAEAVRGLHVVQTHAELQFDKTLNRVVGRIVNEETGETILELPPEQLRALFAKMREQLGPLIDETT